MKEPNRGRSTLYRVARLAVLLAIAGGCEESCSRRNTYGIAVVAGLAHGVTRQAKSAKYTDHILRIRAGRANSGFTFRPAREVWQPFRLETSLGLPDAQHADLGADGSFGVSVTYPQSYVFYSFELKRSGAGIVVTAKAPDVGPVGSLEIPDSTAADVAIEGTGTTVVFYARKYGDAEYVTLGSAPTTRRGPYQLSLDASGLPKGTVIGYDLARLTANGAVFKPTDAQAARETIYTAIDALAEAMYAMDGLTPARATAGDQLDLAVARLDAALALDLTAFKNVESDVTSARKKTAKLVAGVRGRKSPNSVISALIRIVKLAGRAADAAN